LEAFAGAVKDVWIAEVTTRIQGSFSKAVVVDIQQDFSVVTYDIYILSYIAS